MRDMADTCATISVAQCYIFRSRLQGAVHAEAGLSHDKTRGARRTACDEASPTVLNARLKELREAGFVDLGEAGGYALTPLGKELSAQVMPLHRFAEKWSGRT